MSERERIWIKMSKKCKVQGKRILEVEDEVILKETGYFKMTGTSSSTDKIVKGIMQDFVFNAPPWLLECWCVVVVVVIIIIHLKEIKLLKDLKEISVITFTR